MALITASVLYAYVQCPHRLSMDAHEDPKKRDPVSRFVELLWERGTRIEKATLEGLNEPFLDLSGLPEQDLERETLVAMSRGEQLIYGGLIRHDDLLGRPYLLRREGIGYVPGEIKSGAGNEGTEDRRQPKAHYAVRLGLYADILEKLGHSAGPKGFIRDVHGEEVPYDLDGPRAARSRQTLWQLYEQTLASCRSIIGGTEQTSPALTAACKLCHWQSTCRAAVQAADDLSLIPDLGRSRRDAMQSLIPTVESMARIELEDFVREAGTPFERVGVGSLRSFQERAQLLKSNGRPYLTRPISLPPFQTEIFFDIEADPFRSHVYLHGFLVRDRSTATMEFMPFVAEEPEAQTERRAFAEAIAFLQSRPKAMIFVYSSYERATYRRLRERYPDVVDRDEIDALFADRVVDLYRLVKSSTAWPTHDHSIKTLAQYLGFSWRHANPSGVVSIEWYDDLIATGDRHFLEHILEYNEDDCRAMVVLLTAIRGMT